MILAVSAESSVAPSRLTDGPWDALQSVATTSAVADAGAAKLTVGVNVACSQRPRNCSLVSGLPFASTIWSHMNGLFPRPATMDWVGVLTCDWAGTTTCSTTIGSCGNCGPVLRKMSWALRPDTVRAPCTDTCGPGEALHAVVWIVAEYVAGRSNDFWIRSAACTLPNVTNAQTR